MALSARLRLMSPRRLRKNFNCRSSDAAVKESTERVKSAITNCGYKYPKTTITCESCTRGHKKEGPPLTLPIALGMLLGSKAFSSSFSRLRYRRWTCPWWPRPACQCVLSMAMTAKANGLSRDNSAAGYAAGGCRCRRLGCLMAVGLAFAGDRFFKRTASD